MILNADFNMIFILVLMRLLIWFIFDFQDDLYMIFNVGIHMITSVADTGDQIYI